MREFESCHRDRALMVRDHHCDEITVGVAVIGADAMALDMASIDVIKAVSAGLLLGPDGVAPCTGAG